MTSKSTDFSIQAAIDIGTNTILMLVGEVDRSQRRPRINQVLGDYNRYVRLGQGVHQNRCFAPDAMERAMKVFREYATECKRLGVQKIRAVATSASRDSSNSDAFYDRVASETGIRVEIIPGESEATYSFIGGLLPAQDPSHSAILDIGGGSTEFVVQSDDGQGVTGQSIDIGSVRATEMFLRGDPYEKSSVIALESGVKKMWMQIDRSLADKLREREWTAIAGTPTTLAAMALKLATFDPLRVDGYRLSRCAVGDWFEHLALMTNAERLKNPFMGTGRADIMVAGVGILLSAMEYFEKDDVVVSTRGLRYGVLLT